MTAHPHDLLATLDAQIAAKHLLNHDFYQAWSKGLLSLQCLREYAAEYYHHVKAFPTYLSALHSRVDDQNVRRVLLQNLIEEEAGSPNHPELWRQFALALGVTDEQLECHAPNRDIQHLITEFRSICAEQPITEGVAALYAYESQIPAICISKIKGLRAHYGMTDPNSWEYFRVHIQADEEHAAQERALIEALPSQPTQMKAAVARILEALWNFLSGLCQRFGITSASCACVV